MRICRACPLKQARCKLIIFLLNVNVVVLQRRCTQSCIVYSKEEMYTDATAVAVNQVPDMPIIKR